MTSVVVYLKKLGGSDEYEYQVGLTGVFYPDGSIRADRHLVDEAREAAVDEGRGTKEELLTWTPEIVRVPPLKEPDYFD